MMDVTPLLVAAGVVGLVVAAAALRPALRAADVRAAWPALVAGGAALTLLLPVTVVVAQQTAHLRQHGLTEVGSAAFDDPPMPEAPARALRDALQPGDTWAVVTAEGRCEDLYAFYWLAFRVVPNVPDCDAPDVEVLWRVAADPTADVAAAGDDWAVIRR